MATIEKRGGSYRITVSCGYSASGKQVRKKITWTPAKGMTKRQVEKELERQTVLFEEQCRTGQFLEGNITLAEFAERWFKDYAEKYLKAHTVERYRELSRRILAALGNIKLSRLRPQHLMDFYNDLAKGGIRLDTRYRATSGFAAAMERRFGGSTGLAAASSVSEVTIAKCLKRACVSKETADKLTAALGDKCLFEAVDGEKPLAGKTIAEHHRLLSSMLTTAVQWQIIPSNPCARVKPPRYTRKEAVALEPEEVAHLIKSLRGEPLKYRTIIMLALYTGMRRGEICGLNWTDVDFENETVTVNKAVLYTTGKGLYEDTPKTKSSNRTIRIPPDMAVLLKEYRAAQEAQRAAAGAAWHESGKIFTSATGGIMNPDNLSNWFKSFARRIGLPDIHFHTLRHTSATLLIAGGADIATVSKRLGHADRTTTLNIYTHAVKSADETAADLLQSIFTGAEK